MEATPETTRDGGSMSEHYIKIGDGQATIQHPLADGPDLFECEWSVARLPRELADGIYRCIRWETVLLESRTSDRGWRLQKRTSSGIIDGIVALAIAWNDNGSTERVEKAGPSAREEAKSRIAELEFNLDVANKVAASHLDKAHALQADNERLSALSGVTDDLVRWCARKDYDWVEDWEQTVDMARKAAALLR